MNNKPQPTPPPDPLSLKRWSRRKLEAARAQSPRPAEGAPAQAIPASQQPQLPEPPEQAIPKAAPALPPIESLTIDSDFAPFFKLGIPETAKRAALKQLFRDPRFNIMDGLDVYIDDYTQPDPIPSEMMARLQHTRYIFNPPKTEVNAEGHVVDVIEPVEQAEPGESPAAAVAISDGTGDANPESLPRAIDPSADPAEIRQDEAKGDAKS